MAFAVWRGTVWMTFGLQCRCKNSKTSETSAVVRSAQEPKLPIVILATLLDAIRVQHGADQQRDRHDPRHMHVPAGLRSRHASKATA